MHLSRPPPAHSRARARTAHSSRLVLVSCSQVFTNGQPERRGRKAGGGVESRKASPGWVHVKSIVPEGRYSLPIVLLGPKYRRCTSATDVRGWRRGADIRAWDMKRFGAVHEAMVEGEGEGVDLKVYREIGRRDETGQLGSSHYRYAERDLGSDRCGGDGLTGRG